MKILPIVPLVSCCVIGVLVFVIGVSISPIFEAVLHSQFPQLLPLASGSANLAIWEDPMSSADAYISFYFFDIVNPEDVKAGAKPKLQQKGPYVYTERKVKKSVKFAENDTVFYREVRTMTFNPEMTKGTENDTFTTLNVPVLTVLLMLEPYGDLAVEGFQIALDEIFPDEKLFKKLSVYQLLWGYQDSILSDISKLNDILHLSLPIPPHGYFGIFFQKNDTDDGIYSVNTGKSNLNDFLQISTWNGSSTLPFWKTKYCNMINGTDGTMYHPFVDTTDVLYVFSSDVCRSLPLVYTDTLFFNNTDISVYRFKPQPSLFAYPPTNPDSGCYCIQKECPHSGVLDISKCQQGAPVYLSQPHFLNGPYYESLVIGLSPNETQHNTLIDVEPTLGVVLNGAKRLQMNIDVNPNPHMKEMVNLKKLLMPLIWLEEAATLNDHGMKLLNDQFFNAANTVKFLHWFMLIGGIAILIACLAYTISWRLKIRRAEREKLNPTVSEKSPLVVNQSGQKYQTDNDWDDMVRDRE